MSAPIPYTGPDGERHFLSKEELDSVEVTGRCSWQEYAAKPYRPKRVQFIDLGEIVRTRPGAVPKGARPVQLPEKITVQAPSQMAHWVGCRCASVIDKTTRTTALDTREFKAHPLKCSRCLKAFNLQ